MKNIINPVQLAWKLRQHLGSQDNIVLKMKNDGISMTLHQKDVIFNATNG